MYNKLMTTLITPWVEKEEINLLILKSLINHLIRLNTSTILLTASSLDSRTLSNDDKKYLYEETIKIVNNRTAIYAGLDCNCECKSLVFIEKVDHLKIDGYFIIIPYHGIRDCKRIIQFIRDVRKCTSKPIIIRFKSKAMKSDVIINLLEKLLSIKDVNIKGFEVSKKNHVAITKYKNKICKKKFKMMIHNLEFYTGDEHLLFDANVGRDEILRRSSEIYKMSMRTFYEILKTREEKKSNEILELYKQKFKELTDKNNVIRVKDQINRSDEIHTIYKAGYIKYATERSIDSIFHLAGIMDGKDKEYYVPKDQEKTINDLLANVGCKFEQEPGYVKITQKSLNDERFNQVKFIKETSLNDTLFRFLGIFNKEG
ncbi:dihydrodipicolinate synthase family protein [Haloplasma contractile]|uniref:Dihydrodipicolinate synthetase protein n=1 Tax=Haloplasma contractile SSD-17B TaxID=1033810 RepID=U2DZS7_9MOLU|nr:dihydrodipicolinate synthase family protein [Haloplasma contractile]ERJ13692.1 Dihydrodipicolinate synthetase protein [Haloplasma contractile SSD-17B]